MSSVDIDSIDRKRPDAGEAGSIFTRYIKTNDFQLEKLTSDSFRINEILDFYDETSRTTFPENPKNAIAVRDIFAEVVHDWNEQAGVYYGVRDEDYKNGYIGDMRVKPIDWSSGEATVQFYLPNKEDCLAEVLEGLLIVLLSDLGLDLVHVLAYEESADAANEYIESVNGTYDGTKRSNDTGEIEVLHRWSITSDELLDNADDKSAGLSYQ